MTHFSRKSLIGTFALVASLSAPLAFAQSTDASAQATAPTAVAAQADTATQGDAAASASTAASATATASPGKKSWADVDADKDGKLTKTEAAIVPALGQVFDKADGNTDGALTADEYKAYVAKVQGKAPAGGGSK